MSLEFFLNKLQIEKNILSGSNQQQIEKRGLTVSKLF